MTTITKPNRYDVVILGAGYAGLMAALRFGRAKVKVGRVALNADDHFVERIRLQETIAQPIASRIPTIRSLLVGTVDFIRGRAHLRWISGAGMIEPSTR